MGKPDVLKIGVMENVPQEYRKHDLITFTEGDSISRSYYAGASSFAGQSLKVRAMPNSFVLAPFQIDVTVNYN